MKILAALLLGFSLMLTSCAMLDKAVGTYGRLKVVVSSGSRVRFFQPAANEPAGSEKPGIWEVL